MVQAANSNFFDVVRRGFPFTLSVACPTADRRGFVVEVSPFLPKAAAAKPALVEWYDHTGTLTSKARLASPNERTVRSLKSGHIQLSTNGVGMRAMSELGIGDPMSPFPEGTDMLLAVSTDRRIFVFAGDDKLAVRDNGEDKLVPSLGSHIGSPALSPDGADLAVASDERVVIFKTSDLMERCHFELEGLHGIIPQVRYGSSSNRLAVVTQQGLEIYDVTTAPKQILSLPDIGHIADWWDEKELIVATPGFARINVISAKNGQVVQSIETGGGQCHGVYLLEENRIVSVQNGMQVRLYQFREILPQ